MPFWDEVVAEVGGAYPDVENGARCTSTPSAARFVPHPDRFDVVVGSNLFGDILTDLGRRRLRQPRRRRRRPTSTPSGEYPSMFEPVHGSAPDIAGRGDRQPDRRDLVGAMMLEHLGHAEAAADVITAIETIIAESDVRTRDLGGSATTDEFAEAASTPCPRRRHAGQAGPRRSRAPAG